MAQIMNNVFVIAKLRLTLKKVGKTSRPFRYDQNSILKSRGITLPAKVHLVKAMVYTVVRYGCEICSIKEAEC